MAVYNYLDVSTTHITAEDNALLKSADANNLPVVVFPYRYGYFIPVPDATDFPERLDEICASGLSKAFSDLIRFAVMIDCKLIRLDCDADELQGFPRFSW